MGFPKFRPQGEALGQARGMDSFNFTTHFRSAASRETLDPDELRKRLLLCLYALGTNLGIKLDDQGF